MDGYKETLFSALLKADELLRDPPTISPTPVTTTPPTTPATKANAVRLPNSDLTKWTSFWESFEAAVDSNPDLSSSRNSTICPLYWRIQLEKRLLVSPSLKLTTPRLYQLSRRDFEEHNR